MTDQEMQMEHIRALEEEIAQFRRAKSQRCTCRESKTLRDEFAMAAMTALLSQWETPSDEAKKEMSRHAYEVADAMLETRKFGGENGT
ncbi:hypothetical protein EH221_07065 [bacterium]|nr:MAG: hypothetical protein EH221_07065 [bacterium]